MENLKKTILSWFKITTKREIINDLERIEEHYKDIKVDLTKIQQSIDPISKLLIDMESHFRNHKKSKG